MRTKLLLSLVLACVAGAAPASAASLHLRDGSTLLVTTAPPNIGPRATEALAHRAPLVGLALRPDGSTWSGAIPGSEGVLLEDLALGQNPVTGEISIVFARPASGGRDLAAVGWTGQGWTDPQDLTETGADDRRPLLAYRSNGDALLAWVANDGKPNLFLRHFDLAPGFDARTFTFVDLGDPASILPEAAARLGSDPQLLHVVPATESSSVYVLLGSSDGTPGGVLRVELDSVVDPGGFGAAPVPVSFIRSTTQSAGSASDAALGGRNAATTGRAFEPWRIVAGSDAAWYWAEEVRAQLVPIRAGIPGAPVAFDAPLQELQLHLAAYRLARAELGFSPRRRVRL